LVRCERTASQVQEGKKMCSYRCPVRSGLNLTRKGGEKKRVSAPVQEKKGRLAGVVKEGGEGISSAGVSKKKLLLNVRKEERGGKKKERDGPVPKKGGFTYSEKEGECFPSEYFCIEVHDQREGKRKGEPETQKKRKKRGLLAIEAVRRLWLC